MSTPKTPQKFRTMFAEWPAKSLATRNGSLPSGSRWGKDEIETFQIVRKSAKYDVPPLLQPYLQAAQALVDGFEEMQAALDLCRQHWRRYTHRQLSERAGKFTTFFTLLAQILETPLRSDPRRELRSRPQHSAAPSQYRSLRSLRWNLRSILGQTSYHMNQVINQLMAIGASRRLRQMLACMSFYDVSRRSHCGIGAKTWYDTDGKSVSVQAQEAAHLIGMFLQGTRRSNVQDGTIFPAGYAQYLKDGKQTADGIFLKLEEHGMFQLQKADDLERVFTIIVALHAWLQSAREGGGV